MKIHEYNEMMSYLTRPAQPIDRLNKAIGGGVIKGEDLGTREGFQDPTGTYEGARGRNRPKGTTLNNLFKEDPKLKANIKKEYQKGSGADRIIRDLNLSGKIGSRSLQDYILDELEAGNLTARVANKAPDKVKDYGKESKKFINYIVNTYGENPPKNVFQNIEAPELIKKSKTKITRANATRILSKVFDLPTKGARLEKFYPDAESRAIELLNKETPINQIGQILEKENLIKLNRLINVGDGKPRPDYKGLKSYLQRLIDDKKTKVKEIPKAVLMDLETQKLRDTKIIELLDKQDDVVTSNKIAKLLSKELGENISSNYVEGFFKRNNLNIEDFIQNRQKRIFPEIQAMDKIVKSNLNLLTDPNIPFSEKGKFLAEEYTKAVGKTKAQTITSTEPGLRLVKLLSIYAGDEQRYEKDLYSKIKPLKNYTNQNIQKNLISLASNLHRASNIDMARMLGLPKKDISLLSDLSKAATQLGDFKMAGDHTDIKSIMKDFPGFKKNFLRIEFIKDELNQLKSYYDKKVLALYNRAKSGGNPADIRKELGVLQNDFTKKTGYRLGGFDFDKKGNVVINPETPMITERRYPINDNLLNTMQNIEGFKFKTEFKNPLDRDILKTQSPNERLQIYNKYKDNVKVLNNSKYVKAIESIPRFKNFKTALVAGGAGAGALVASAASADDLPPGIKPKGSPGQINPEKTLMEEYPMLTTTAAAAAPLATKKGRKIYGALAKPLLSGALKTIGSVPVSAYLAGKELSKEDPNYSIAGLELLLPELGKRVPGSGTGILSKVGRFAVNPIGRLARSFTPVGLGLQGVQLVNEAMKEQRRINEMRETDPEAYQQFIAEQEDMMRESAAYGGRMGFADGPEDPSKRKTMKILGGLATLPLVGRFFDVAQVAEKAAPAVVEGAKSVPPYFFRLVDKIRALGRSGPGTKDRSESFVYGDYEMEIDYDTGAIDIKRTEQGMFGDEIAPTEEVNMFYRPGRADETTGGKTPPDDYEEYTVRPDGDGKMKDVEEGVPDDVVDEGSISKEELEQLIIRNLANE